jgi:choline dehydrogenase
MSITNALIYILGVSFTWVIFILVTLQEDKLLHHDNYRVHFHDERFPTSFDFIIVGAGSAGSVLANRLSSNEKYKVLLLEAGGTDNDLSIKIPIAQAKTYGTKFDWNYNSVPQVNKGNYTVYLPRGKVLGGSSSINAMIYLRGSAYDYDNWSKKYNLTGWDYDTMLKYFKKSEKQVNKKLNKDFHGYEGEWVISDVKRHFLTELLAEAYNKVLGLPFKDDFNGERYQEEGIGFNQVNINEGERWSLSDAFLNNNVMKRKNLYIRTEALVSKVVFEGNTAVGVEILLKNGEVKTIKATKEVILSAGAYNTPQILQLSGIGDKKLLEKLGIKVISNNPEVGQNLQDHPTFGIVDILKEEMSLDKYDRFPHNIYPLFEWMYNKTNVLGTNVAELNGFIKSPYAKEHNEAAPDMQLIGGAGVYVDHGRKKFDVPGGVSMGFVLLNPKSRGFVKIQSADPRVPPIIDINMFDPKTEDLKRMLSMIEPLKKIKQYEKLKQHTSGSLINDILSDTIEQIQKSIDEHSFLLYHPCCTAAMGKVVDSRLRVSGVKNLRIVDTSVMPEITRANTNAPTVAIAEKASDMILEDNLN